MELDNKTFIIGVNVRDLRTPFFSSEHIFADVVLIDRSSDMLYPLLYQLHRGVFTEYETRANYYEPRIFPLDENAFAMMGEVMSIDKTRKMIYLSNRMTVAYKHLIVATGLNQKTFESMQEADFNEGVQALLEALRVRKHVFDALTFPNLTHLGFNRKERRHKAKLALSEDLPFSNIHHLLSKNPTEDLSTIDSLLGSEHRLYQLQL